MGVGAASATPQPPMCSSCPSHHPQVPPWAGGLLLHRGHAGGGHAEASSASLLGGRNGHEPPAAPTPSLPPSCSPGGGCRWCSAGPPGLGACGRPRCRSPGCSAHSSRRLPGGWQRSGAAGCRPAEGEGGEPRWGPPGGVGSGAVGRGLTSKTSSSRRRVPKTVIPRVSMAGWGPRGSGRDIFFLQSRKRVTCLLLTLRATRCHLRGGTGGGWRGCAQGRRLPTHTCR